MKRRIWIISDTHFGHKKMTEPDVGRPEDFEELIQNNLLKMTKPEDLLIHLGDVCIGEDKEWNEWITERFEKCWLVLGNHDGKSINWYLDCGWSFVGESVSLKMFGKHIFLSHKPVEYLHELYNLNIHGHLHNNGHRGDEIKDGRHFLYSCERENYRPLLLEKICGKQPSNRIGGRGEKRWCKI